MRLPCQTVPALIAAASFYVTSASAQISSAPTQPERTAADEWSLHAQSTVIEQWHGGFHAPYTGPNSLSPTTEDKHTVTVTGFLGGRLWEGAELFYDPEVSQGTGLSNTVGVAGFPNGEATRAGATTPEYDTARLFLRESIGLGGEQETVDSDQNQTAGHRDADRLTITIGKLSATDVFDVNRYSHDPRTQFLNWALMANGAWDYPADTKGYTGGIIVEWTEHNRSIAWGAFMEPKEANGRPLDSHLREALGQVLQWEQRYTVSKHAGAVRLLAYWNHAHMGSYAGALQSASPPNVTTARQYRSKVGAGVNWEQELSDNVGIFARVGYNDGRTESWAFTEIDRTGSLGISISGGAWSRHDDTVGVAAVVNGLSPEHRRYLEAGGLGFIIGDGRLHYGAEQAIESYYDWALAKWIHLAFDVQVIRNPAYNLDRGPVAVFAVRTHIEF